MANLKFVGNANDLEYVFPNQDYLSAWDSFEGFTRHVEVMKADHAWQGSGWENDHDGEDGFHGTRDMKQAIDMARGGWKEGVEKVERLRNRILALHPISRKVVKYGPVGSIPSVPRAVAGDPNNMKILDNSQSSKRKLITLISIIGANCQASTSVLSNRGAIVAAIVDHVEGAGFACEIITCAQSTGGWSGTAGYNATTAIRVKEPHHPVDITRLAFSLGHASMFRRLVFADWGIEPKNKRGLGYGLGHTNKTLVSTEEMVSKNIFLLPSPESNHKLFAKEEASVTEGLPYIINSLRKQGCPAFPKWDEREEPVKNKKVNIFGEFEDEDDDDE